MKRSFEQLELNKILAAVAGYAVLEHTKEEILCLEPAEELSEARRLLDTTEEAARLIFELGAGKIEYFPPMGDALERAEKGAALSLFELLGAAKLLRSARVLYDSVHPYAPSLPIFGELCGRLTFDRALEREIGEKILSEDAVADTASERLFSIRREIALLGERIRARLQQYLQGEERKFLQDAIVTVRGDRFVIPVKAEYKRSIRGFVHDRSQSGATVFIEPEETLEMNNELRTLMIDEKEEVERIVKELSARLGKLRAALESAQSLLCEADGFYARAEYCYALHAVKPTLNRKGVVEIKQGRHPLLDPKTAVPVSVSVGRDCRFLLISGANTGGKTVTLKMCGLFCLMAACGLFVPAAACELTVSGVYCDLGDSQSIEENLSTFSSHIVNLKEILKEAGEYSFVLIDEPGGGTDPEEGQALARATLCALARKGCRGIVTTHYSALKEFAYQTEGFENGSMEFDAEGFRPLYRLKMGAPGSSNALAICTRLGFPAETVEEARGYLSEGARAFERTLRAAEESRIRAETLVRENERLRAEWQTRLNELEREERKFSAEKEKFLASSKAEARRIVAERTAEAEEILAQIEAVFRKEHADERDLIRARTLKNKMKEIEIAEERAPERARPVDRDTLKAGDYVRISSMDSEGVVRSVNREKGVAEVQAGSLRVKAKITDLYVASKKEETPRVRVTRDLGDRTPAREINLIGMTTGEMVSELETFLDGASLANYGEVRIIHGTGTGKLRAAVHALLKKHPRVESFRLGVYGEGEGGVTVVTLK